MQPCRAVASSLILSLPFLSIALLWFSFFLVFLFCIPKGGAIKDPPTSACICLLMTQFLSL